MHHENMRILLTGKSGQLGSELRTALAGFGDVIAIDRDEMDLCDAAAVRRVVREIAPDLLVNAAGYTLVDRAEADPSPAQAINADACAVLAELACEMGYAIVHYSTDYVFDGGAQRPYRPSDAPNPLNAYGRSKLAGEHAIRQSGCRHLILRTSWLYGFHGNNFLLAMLRLAERETHLRVVNDQIGCPTWSRTVARATAHILQSMLTRSTLDEAFDALGGTYHVTSLGETSWHDFAVRIFQFANLDPMPVVTAVTSVEFPRPARRPAYSVLDCSSAQRTFALDLPHWADALREAFESDHRPAPPVCPGACKRQGVGEHA